MEKTLQIPVTINNEGGSYWGEAQIFSGCFSQGDTLKEFGDNMTLAIGEYVDGVNEGFFDIPNTGILNINLDNNGRVKGNFLKKINKETYKTLSGGQAMKV